jgi:hypothetical protein
MTSRRIGSKRQHGTDTTTFKLHVFITGIYQLFRYCNSDYININTYKLVDRMIKIYSSFSINTYERIRDFNSSCSCSQSHQQPEYW